MKTYKEMADDVLRRIDEYQRKQQKKRKIAITAVIPVCCVCLILLMGIWRSGVLFPQLLQGSGRPKMTEKVSPTLFPGPTVGMDRDYGSMNGHMSFNTAAEFTAFMSKAEIETDESFKYVDTFHMFWVEKCCYRAEIQGCWLKDIHIYPEGDIRFLYYDEKKELYVHLTIDGTADAKVGEENSLADIVQEKEGYSVSSMAGNRSLLINDEETHIFGQIGGYMYALKTWDAVRQENTDEVKEYIDNIRFEKIDLK